MLTAGAGNNVVVTLPNDIMMPRPIKIEPSLPLVLSSGAAKDSDSNPSDNGAAQVDANGADFTPSDNPITVNLDESQQKEAVNQDEKKEEETDSKIDDGAHADNPSDQLNSDAPDNNMETGIEEQSTEIGAVVSVRASVQSSVPVIDLLDTSDDAGINACEQCDQEKRNKRAGNNVRLIILFITLDFTNGFFFSLCL